jgi:hypothetical protein
MNSEQFNDSEYFPTKHDIAEWEKEAKVWEQSRLHHQLARTYLKEYETAFLEITQDDINELVSIIEHSNREEDIQQFLQSHPNILTHYLGGGHGRYCLPKKSLGGMYIPDFLLADLSSLGISWHAVELKNPKAKMFNKNGDYSRQLNHAMKQIRDWRDWLKNNLNEARNLRQEKGLSLIGIEPELDCLMLIGRRKDLDETIIESRRRMNKEINGEVHTYDWLIEHAKGELTRVETRKKGKEIRERLGIKLEYHHIEDKFH